MEPVTAIANPHEYKKYRYTLSYICRMNNKFLTSQNIATKLLPMAQIDFLGLLVT